MSTRGVANERVPMKVVSVFFNNLDLHDVVNTHMLLTVSGSCASCRGQDKNFPNLEFVQRKTKCATLVSVRLSLFLEPQRNPFHQNKEYQCTSGCATAEVLKDRDRMSMAFVLSSSEFLKFIWVAR
ncbi:hypothetical protein TRVL_02167 [Trypanosoma vivax]|uniref:Uncharacterized protein n=1 Tax=Trypanosoma vivax (strain Y486) TaxID=1055687 RepID=G0U6V0_TRYVY|nr:hypothetical protein TRVL_02167 [Trypanosoma vivax]CCC51606.1 hypothetical protein TVY486_1006540 [Trypanosoma vivax Y486]